MSRIGNPNKHLSDKELATLKDNAIGILSECRRKLLAQFPFTGSVMMNMELVPVRDNRIPTACTDGKTIYFSISFLASLKPEERTFVLAHEVWHAVMAHMTREAKRDHKLANIAEDIEVNELLVAEGLSCPKSACRCLNHQLPTGHSFEEYYEMLVNQKNQNQSNSDNIGNSGSSSNSNNSDNSDTSDNSNDSNTPTGGNQSESVEGQFDKHIHKGDDFSKDKGNPDMVDKYGAVDQDPDYQPQHDENLAEKLREAVISAAQQYERCRGEMPGHLKSLVNKMLTPEIDWKEALASFISKAQGEGHTNWSLPNKRLYANGIYMPSKIGDKVRIGCMIDTSGSCVQDLQKFLSEVNGIVKSFGNYELHICQCDWDVRDFQSYDESNPLDLENTEFHCHGGGGTRLLPGLQSFEMNNIEVDCIVAFSDLECEIIEENDINTPLLWVSTTKGKHENIKCGTIVNFK